MTYIVGPYRSSERVVFRNRFMSALDVYSADGTLYNSPTFLAEGGMSLNGINQSVSFPCNSLFGNLTSITIKVVFTPDFDTDENAYRYICDSTTGSRYILVKYNNAGSNVLQIMLGNTNIAFIAEATYSPYWNVGEKNTLIVASKSANTDAYLNGNQILTADNSAWSPGFPTTLYVGSSNSPGAQFDGIIHEFSIYQGKWTYEDAMSDYDGSMFNYNNRAKIWCDMTTLEVSGSGHITKDKSKNGYHLELGDGAGSNEPTFLNPGMDMDGSNHYLHSDNVSGLFNSSEITIAVVFGPDFFTDLNSYVYLYDTSTPRYIVVKYNNAAGNALYIYLGGTYIGNAAEAVYSPFWNVQGMNVLVVCGKDANTDVYLNGHIIIEGDNTNWANGDASEIMVGCSNTYGSKFDGSIFFFGCWHEKLGSLQVRDLTMLLQNKYH